MSRIVVGVVDHAELKQFQGCQTQPRAHRDKTWLAFDRDVAHYLSPTETPKSLLHHLHLLSSLSLLISYYLRLRSRGYSHYD
jgi:hypothetical protein